MKDDNTTFKAIREKQLSHRNKLKEQFKAHFNICSQVVDPIEFKNSPNFIRQLQNINNTELNNTSPGIEELRSTVKPLKN